MLNSMFQLAFNGGDTCKAGFLESAIHSAYLQPNSDSMLKPVGGLSVIALFTANNRQAKVQPI